MAASRNAPHLRVWDPLATEDRESRELTEVRKNRTRAIAIAYAAPRQTPAVFTVAAAALVAMLVHPLVGLAVVAWAAWALAEG
jgi:hypothetical protein